MARIEALIAATFICLVASLVQAQNVLKCWQCSSDANGSSFCADPFEPDLLTTEQKSWSYVNCTSIKPVGLSGLSDNSRPACKKLIQEIYGKRVVSRSCFWEDTTDSADKCENEATPSYIKTVHCRTCTADGCNSASGVVPIVILFMIAVALLKLISL